MKKPYNSTVGPGRNDEAHSAAVTDQPVALVSPPAALQIEHEPLRCGPPVAAT